MSMRNSGSYSMRRETRLSRSLLLARQQLAKQRRDLENQVRALLRGFGLAVGTVSKAQFEERVWALVGRESALEAAVGPLLQVRRSLCLHLRELEGRNFGSGAAPFSHIYIFGMNGWDDTNRAYGTR